MNRVPPTPTEVPRARVLAASVQIASLKEKLAETQIMVDERDVQIATLKAQLEVAERIATQEHSEMISQDSIHAIELESMNKKLDQILAALTAKDKA